MEKGGGGVRWTYYFGLHSARVYAKLRLNATTAARHGTASALAKSLQRVAHALACVCVRLCVWRHFRFPHTLEGNSSHAACTVPFCMHLLFLLFYCEFMAPLVLCSHSLTLTPHAVHRPLCEWVSEWCVCIALNSLLLLQWERARESESNTRSSREWVFICLRVCVCV